MEVSDTKLECGSVEVVKQAWFPHLLTTGPGKTGVSFHKMAPPLSPEVVFVLEALAKTTPDKADVVALWVTDGIEFVVNECKLVVDTFCIVRDYTTITTEGTHVTGDMTGERGDDMVDINVRHVGMLDGKRASWIVIDRPREMLGFETKDEYDKWVAEHLAFERKDRAEQLDILFGKLASPDVSLHKEDEEGTKDEKDETKKTYNNEWPVDTLNGWFKFLWNRRYNTGGVKLVLDDKPGQLERTRAHCIDAVGRHYITSLDDAQRPRMTKWSGVEPPSTLGEYGKPMAPAMVLMWVNYDPQFTFLNDFKTTGVATILRGSPKILAPLKVGDVLPLTSVGVTGQMRVIATNMNIGEPVGWVYAEVTGLPEEHASDDISGESYVENDQGDDGDCDETEDGTTPIV
jgi:hypothetical protein